MKSLRSWAIIALLVVTSGAAEAGDSDDAAVRNKVTCYPFGLDKIGRGDEAGGGAIWRDCFTPDFQFSVNIGRGDPIVCPGANCPFPTDMPAIEKRVAFAKNAFNAGGFVKTSHHLTNVTISFPQEGEAVVNAYVQAWHWKRDNTVVVAPGTWDAELVLRDGKWLISKENLAIVGAAVIPSPSPPSVAK
jgi:hypothetical protein